MFCITILAPEPPAFGPKMCFGHQLFKNMITYTVWKFRKSNITHQKNVIESNLDMADLSGSPLSTRSYENIQSCITDAKHIVHLLYFHSRVARIATQNLSFTTNSTFCFLSLTHSTVIYSIIMSFDSSIIYSTYPSRHDTVRSSWWLGIFW